MGKRTILMIDPPEGILYGFPKACPENWGLWSWEKKKIWYVEEGYPKELLTDTFRITLVHREIEETWLNGKANI
tara:strand:- start:1046 stop:1267 length:222 start_codon:yes stop_codon:yes gene_type:complete